MFMIGYGPDLEKIMALKALPFVNKPNASEAKRQDQTREKEFAEHLGMTVDCEQSDKHVSTKLGRLFSR